MKGQKQQSECICEGNWRAIIAESEPKFGSKYKNTSSGVIYTFVGVMHCDDDYYYCLVNSIGQLRRLSCVGNIEMFGYEEV